MKHSLSIIHIHYWMKGNMFGSTCHIYAQYTLLYPILSIQIKCFIRATNTFQQRATNCSIKKMFSIKSPENQVNCIYGVIRPLYLYARLIGFFPFSVQIQLNGKNNKIYFTLIDFVILVVHLTFYAFFVYANIQHNFMENTAASPLLTFGSRTLLIFGIANGIVFISADLCNRYKIFSILVRCQNFDDQVMIGSLSFKI